MVGAGREATHALMRADELKGRHEALRVAIAALGDGRKRTRRKPHGLPLSRTGNFHKCAARGLPPAVLAIQGSISRGDLRGHKTQSSIGPFS